MAVTGRADGPGLVCPAPLASAADAMLAALKALVARPEMLPANGALLLGERARLLGLRRGGRRSANGACRLLDASDGRIALNLARDEDWDLMPALFEREQVASWESVGRLVAARPARDLVARGIALGLPIAIETTPPTASLSAPVQSEDAAASPPRGRPLVVEFASLWAGPLAGSLLHMAGARVVKVESSARPDGMRAGHRGFYDLLNAGKESVAVDFGDPHALRQLRRLVDRADIVIEGSRPRALRRIGIDRTAMVARGGVWVGLTAHSGRDGPDRVGFGDDASVAGGLSQVMAQAWGEPMFAGDAIADPLTGLAAALGAWAAWSRGGGRLLTLALADTVARAIGQEVADPALAREWQAMAERDATPLYPLRRPARSARASGADSRSVLAGG